MFAKQQEAMLEAMWQLLKKGGKLLYATCSIFNGENQKVIDRFIKEHIDAKEVKWSVDSEYRKYENPKFQKYENSKNCQKSIFAIFLKIGKI